MLEVVEDPFLFHQSTSKVEVTLTILRAIVTFLEAALDFP